MKRLFLGRKRPSGSNRIFSWQSALPPQVPHSPERPRRPPKRWLAFANLTRRYAYQISELLCPYIEHRISSDGLKAWKKRGCPDEHVCCTEHTGGQVVAIRISHLNRHSFDEADSDCCWNDAALSKVPPWI